MRAVWLTLSASSGFSFFSLSNDNKIKGPLYDRWQSSSLLTLA